MIRTEVIEVVTFIKTMNGGCFVTSNGCQALKHCKSRMTQQNGCIQSTNCARAFSTIIDSSQLSTPIYIIYWSKVLTERFSILYKNQTKEDLRF